MRHLLVGGGGRRQHRREDAQSQRTAAIAVIHKVGDVGANDECLIN
jgi:hypothetical protein